MRLVFAGSPAAAVPSLTALAARDDHEVVAVVTRDDTPQGRRRVLTPTPVAVEAERLGLPVVRARRLDEAVTERLAALEPDLGVVVAYGALVREPLLSTPRHGWVNLHFSLLPRWRGAAPVQRALLAGDEVTGADVFRLVPELDAGEVLGRLQHRLRGDETAGELLGTLSVTGADLLVDVVDALAAGTAVSVPQEGEVTLAPKLVLADGRLDLTASAAAVLDRWRGVTPEPGAHATFAGETFKVHELRRVDDAVPAAAPGELVRDARRVLVGTCTEPLELVRVQPAGKKAMSAADWWRGLGEGADRRLA